MLKKSSVLFAQQLRSSLLAFPALVNRLERKDAGFIPELFNWMRVAEDCLTTHQSRQAAELAGIRSRILAGRIDMGHGVAKRKQQWKTAADSLFELQQVLQQALIPLEMQLNEARELIRQLLLIVAQTGLFAYHVSTDFDAFVQSIWQFITSNEQLRAGAVKLKTHFNAEDIRLLMAEEINLEDFSKPAKDAAASELPSSKNIDQRRKPAL